jgi:hypothetical protein
MTEATSLIYHSQNKHFSQANRKLREIYLQTEFEIKAKMIDKKLETQKITCVSPQGKLL